MKTGQMPHGQVLSYLRDCKAIEQDNLAKFHDNGNFTQKWVEGPTDVNFYYTFKSPTRAEQMLNTNSSHMLTVQQTDATSQVTLEKPFKRRRTTKSKSPMTIAGLEAKLKQQYEDYLTKQKTRIVVRMKPSVHNPKKCKPGFECRFRDNQTEAVLPPGKQRRWN